MAFGICLNCFKSKGDFEVCPHCGWVEGTLPDPSYHLHPGTALAGRYVVGTTIGYGGFGAIYRAWDTQLQTVVALKEFYPSGLVSRVPGEKQVIVFTGEKEASYRDALERFLTEAKSMAQFNTHPNIVNVLNYFEENNTAYIVMEHLNGVSLSDWLNQRGGKLPPDEALRIIMPVIDALADIHKKGIIHRDIHPRNIFITVPPQSHGDCGAEAAASGAVEANQVKLLDFGAARFAVSGDDEKSLTVVVTPGYASPEQYRSRSKQGFYTDIYGIGATLYKMVTGIVPEESIDRQVDDRLKKPSALGIRMDHSLEKAIMKALAIKPDLRFQTAEQMLAALQKQSSVDYPEVEDQKRRRRRIAIIAILSMALVAAVIITVIFYTSAKPPETLDNIAISRDTISIWLPADADDAVAQARLEAVNEIARAFEEANNQLRLVVTAMPEKEYADRIAAAMQSGELPTVFLTDSLGGGGIVEGAAVSLDTLLRSLSVDDYLLLRDYDSLFPSRREIPTGLRVTVLYGNLNLPTADGPPFPAAVEDWQQLINLPYTFSVGRSGLGSILAQYAGISGQSGALRFPGDMADRLIELKRAIRIKLSESPFEMLENDELAFLADDTSVFASVQGALAGRYEVIPMLQDSRLIAAASGCWAVSVSATKNQQNAAMLFLRFALDAYAQDRLYLQGGGAIPLYKAVLSQYAQSNPDLAPLLEQADRIASVGEYDRMVASFGAAAYDKLFMRASTDGDVRAFVEAYGSRD